MRNSLWFLILPFVLSACSKPSGFKASDYIYDRVQSEEKLSDQGDGTSASGKEAKRNQVIRFSNKIQFTPIESKWNQNQVTLKAQVKVGDKSLGEVEFAGVKKDSKALLTPVKSDLSSQLKAQLICTSEGDSCDDFFIDVFFLDHEQNVVYQDQIIPTPKVKAPKASPPTSASTTTTTTVPVVKTSRMPQPTPAPKSTKEAEPEPENIVDGVEGEDSGTSSYVGTSDEEILNLFEIKGKTSDKKTEKTPVGGGTDTTKKEETDKPPVSTNTGKASSPVDNIDNKKEDSNFESLQVKDQVIGSPVSGRLSKGTDFLKLSGYPGFYFFISNPHVKDYYASFDMAVVIKKLGEALQAILPGKKLAVTALSKWGGGRLPPHEGHQNGTDADFRYLTDDENVPANVVTRGKVNAALLISPQWKLMKMAFATNMVDGIFVDAAVKKALCEEARRSQDYKNGEDDSPGAEVLKRIQAWPGHGNHFHVRIRCSSDQPRCKRVQLSVRNIGC